MDGEEALGAPLSEAEAELKRAALMQRRGELEERLKARLLALAALGAGGSGSGGAGGGAGAAGQPSRGLQSGGIAQVELDTGLARCSSRGGGGGDGVEMLRPF